MKQLTVEELIALKGWSLSKLAYELNLSIPLLSKIKNGKAVITPTTQEAVRRVFGKNVSLIGGEDRWKEKYNSLLDEYNRLKTELDTAKLCIWEMNRLIKKAEEYTEAAKGVREKWQSQKLEK